MRIVLCTFMKGLFYMFVKTDLSGFWFEILDCKGHYLRVLTVFKLFTLNKTLWQMRFFKSALFTLNGDIHIQNAHESCIFSVCNKWDPEGNLIRDTLFPAGTFHGPFPKPYFIAFKGSCSASSRLLVFIYKFELAWVHAPLNPNKQTNNRISVSCCLAIFQRSRADVRLPL